MPKFAYYFHNIPEVTLTWLKEHVGDNVYVDKASQERSRPKLRQVLRVVQSGDELLIARFSNAVRGIYELTLLRELCRLKEVRLISFEDKYDSAGEIFTNDLSAVMSKLSSEIITLRKTVEKGTGYIKPLSLVTAREKKVKRNVTAVNMYLAGISISKILAKTKMSKSTLHQILNIYGIPHRNQRKSTSRCRDVCSRSVESEAD